MATDWTIIAAVLTASVLMIFYTYFLCQRMLKDENYFAEWEQRNECRIIQKERSVLWRKGWYRVSVEDKNGIRRAAWVRFGFFTGKEKTVWD